MTDHTQIIQRVQTSSGEWYDVPQPMSINLDTVRKSHTTRQALAEFERQWIENISQHDEGSYSDRDAYIIGLLYNDFIGIIKDAMNNRRKRQFLPHTGMVN